MTKDTQLDPEEATIEQLLKEAGPRAEPPVEIKQEVYSAVHKEWRTETRSHHAWVKAWFAVAATFLVAVIAGLWQLGSEEETVIARMDRSTGLVELSADNRTWLPVVSQLSKQTDFAQDIYLRTRHQGRLSVTLISGVNIRLDIDTTIQIQSQHDIELLDGAIYVDSGNDPSVELQIQVITPIGAIKDIGTQFEVRLNNDAVQVKVREGVVNFSTHDTVYRTESGISVEVDKTGIAKWKSTQASDPSWFWAQSVAPAFAIENRSLMEFLEWAARETGAQLEFENAFAEAAARRTILHGKLSGFTIQESLQAILATTDLEQVSETPDVILVRMKRR